MIKFRNESVTDVVEPYVFFQKVLELEAAGNIDDALDLLHDEIDKMMWADQILEINNLLRIVDPKLVGIHIILGLLTASLPVRNRLSHHDQFFADSESALRARGEFEEGLLDGL